MAHRVDVHVGKRIRHRREMLDFTQQQLAERIGIKFQQIQKYENGVNRVSASRLWDIAVALDVPVKFFFDGLKRRTVQDITQNFPEAILSDHEARELVRFYHGLPEHQKRQFLALVRTLAEAG